MTKNLGNTQPLLVENDNVSPLDSQNYYHARIGTYLFQWCWQINQNVPLKGIVFLFHGLHEHIGRYEIIANKLTDKGFVVHGIDLHGHGRSVCETRGILPDYHISKIGLDISNTHLANTNLAFLSMYWLILWEALLPH